MPKTHAAVCALLLGTAALAASPDVAAAQPFFRAWGGYYAAPAPAFPFYDEDFYEAPPYYAPGSSRFMPLDGRDIGRRVAAAGYRLAAPVRISGRSYVALGDDRAGRRHRLVFAADGRLTADKLLDDTKRAAATQSRVPPAADRPAPAKAEPAVVPARPPADNRARVDTNPLALPPAADQDRSAAARTTRRPDGAPPASPSGDPAPAPAPEGDAASASPPSDQGK